MATIYDCPAMSWADFLAIPDGTVVFNHGDSQCVALANLFNEGVLGGGFVSVQSALDWWTNPRVAEVHGFSRVASDPQPGDICIASCEIYDCTNGHIFVVTRAWNGVTFGTMEQNVYGEFVSRHDRTMANVDGFLRPINQAVLNPPAPSLLGNQRVAGANGANRRAAPSVSAEILEPHLEPGEVGNFVNWAHAEDPYGSGNDVWFQGVSGNWFYSGAFTDIGTHDLADVTSYPAAPIEPKPEPVVPEPAAPVVVEPVKPPVSEKPETIEHKEKPVSTPSAKPGATDEQIKTLIATAKELKLDDPNAPVIPDNVAKPLWLILALVSSSTPYAFGLTVIDWSAWDATIATQAAALIVAWSGTLASVLGLSRFSKSTAK